MTVYLESILQRLPQILSQIDREFFSLTHGSGDRVHWCWKFTDFPGSRFQEYLFPLAWLYQTDSFDNPWKGNGNLLRMIEAGFGYWSKIQYSDGSFDEAYPFEHSLAATAFTVFYLTEAFDLVASDVAAGTSAKFKTSVRKAADWLCVNDEHHGVLSNHLAAAAAACLNAGILLNEDRYRQRCQHFLDRIYSKQSSEGWYEEYGGADIGYQTHGSFYLARVWQRTSDQKLLTSLKKANDFLTHFIHPDGSIGGEYASRDTMFYYPAAFEMLAKECPASRSILAVQRQAVKSARTVGLPQMDAYNLFPVMNNYIFAHEAWAAQGIDVANASLLACQAIGEWMMADAGLFVKSTKNYYCVVGLKKGGVVRVWNKNNSQLCFQSSGYVFMKANKAYSNQALCGATYERVNADSLKIVAPFVAVNRKVFSPWLFMAFRLFTLTFGRQPKIGYWVKNLLVKVLVRKKSSLPLRLERAIHFSDSDIVIKDTVSDPAIELVHQDKFSTIHMGSSRYAHIEEELLRGRGYPCATQEIDSQGVLKLCKVSVL